ncbi:hypothetical protein S245_069603, partial [Arachis hypogaea]
TTRKALASSSQVSAIHKANVIQKTEACEKSCSFFYLVMSNLYGNIISDLCAGLAGDLGLTVRLVREVLSSTYYRIWDLNACFMKNLANPTALMLRGVSMLRHLNLHDKADQIQNVILDTIVEAKYRTADLGGKAKTTDFTNASIDHL